MREILFRGKRKVNNEWVEGFLFVDRNGLYKIKWYDPHYQSAKTSEVYPETVGQYTGLTDKNGVKIFEGDVLEYVYDDVPKATFCVKMSVEDGAWLAKSLEDDGYFSAKAISLVARVIGNIHDTPKLLEVSGDGKSDSVPYQ